MTCSSPGGDGLGQEAGDVDDGRGGAGVVGHRDLLGGERDARDAEQLERALGVERERAVAVVLVDELGAAQEDAARVRVHGAVVEQARADADEDVDGAVLRAARAGGQRARDLDRAELGGHLAGELDPRLQRRAGGDLAGDELDRDRRAAELDRLVERARASC